MEEKREYYNFMAFVGTSDAVHDAIDFIAEKENDFYRRNVGNMYFSEDYSEFISEMYKIAEKMYNVTINNKEGKNEI